MHPGFKEWALICEALGNGQQSIIIRKGGIAEGREGFSFRHKEFCLFPTWFHEQLTKTKLPPETPMPLCSETELEIRFAASLEWTRVITDPAVLRRLAEHHCWTDTVVQERFSYDDSPGIHLAFVRVFRLEPSVILPMEKRFGGCRSWVDLPDLVRESALVSVLSEEEHALRKNSLLQILS